MDIESLLDEIVNGAPAARVVAEKVSTQFYHLQDYPWTHQVGRKDAQGRDIRCPGTPTTPDREESGEEPSEPSSDALQEQVPGPRNKRPVLLGGKRPSKTPAKRRAQQFKTGMAVAELPPAPPRFLGPILQRFGGRVERNWVLVPKPKLRAFLTQYYRLMDKDPQADPVNGSLEFDTEWAKSRRARGEAQAPGSKFLAKQFGLTAQEATKLASSPRQRQILQALEKWRKANGMPAENSPQSRGKLKSLMGEAQYGEPAQSTTDVDDPAGSRYGMDTEAGRYYQRRAGQSKSSANTAYARQVVAALQRMGLKPPVTTAEAKEFWNAVTYFRTQNLQPEQAAKKLQQDAVPLKGQREVAPPGWEKPIKKMKKDKTVRNPWALAWHMKNKGMKPEEALEALGEGKTKTRIHWIDHNNRQRVDTIPKPTEDAKKFLHKVYGDKVREIVQIESLGTYDDYAERYVREVENQQWNGEHVGPLLSEGEFQRLAQVCSYLARSRLNERKHRELFRRLLLPWR
jgi:hypothetical protein